MYHRQLILDKNPSRSFFLWGARQTGKSSLLKSSYPKAFFIDLLHTEKFVRYKKDPSLLRQELSSSQFKKSFVIIDEIQKVPELLNEVHWLIENKKIIFGLCGSSAKKLKKGHINLLGGRADRFELFGFVSSELKSNFSLINMLNNGYLPGIFSVKNSKRALKSYCEDYLKEEIAHEGLVQNFSVFNNFLEISALSDSEPVNFINIARECGISAVTAKNYFYLLRDTLIADFLPCYRKKPKRRTAVAPKFYFSDVGVVNHFAKRFDLRPGNPLFGKAFENWIHHELKSYLSYKELPHNLSYWRLSSGIEVDFIVGAMEVAIEAKAVKKVSMQDLKGLRELKKEYPLLRKRFVVCMEPQARVIMESSSNFKKDQKNGIEILPYSLFTKKLWSNKLF